MGSGPRTSGSPNRLLWLAATSPVGRGVLDLLVDNVVVAVDAVGVNGLQDVDAVPGAGGDLGRRVAGVQPQGQGGVPAAAIQAFAEHATAGAAEQPPVGRGPVVAQVLVQQRGRTGGMGTIRTAPSGRCLRPRTLWGLPVLVQADPVGGQALVRITFPTPSAGG